MSIWTKFKRRFTINDSAVMLEEIAKAVSDSNKKVPDKVINNVIEEGEVNFSERVKLMKTVEDIDILTRRVLDEFSVIYRNCKDKKEIQVVDMVNEVVDVIKEKVGEDRFKEEIQPEIQKIVAKKIAENYYNDYTRGTNIYTLSQLMSLEDMIEYDLTDKVGSEYKKIEEKRGEKQNRFNKKGLRKKILSELGRKIAYKYNETGTLVIPQSVNMKNIERDEREEFIKTIKKHVKKPLTKEEVGDAHRQSKSTSNNTLVKENTLIHAIKKFPEGKKFEYIELLTGIVENGENLKTIMMIQKAGLIEKLNAMPEESKMKMINTINKVIEKRQINVAKKSPEFKKATFSRRNEGAR